MLCSILTQFGNAQLKVSSSGNIGIQVGSNSPLSTLAIGDIGATDSKVSITGNTSTLLKIQRTANSSTTSFGIDASTNVLASSPTWNYGLRGTSYTPNISPYARNYGIFGLAGNGTAYNYGLFGQLAGNAYGSAVVGLVSTSVSQYTEVGITGMYAGYFVGDVKVTGLINGVTIGNSDKRYKKNIDDLDSKETLENLSILKPVQYNLNQIYVKATKDSVEVETPLYDENSQLFKKKHYGLIAQDLQKVYPDLVYEDNAGYLAIEYTGLIPILIQSIKELKSEIEILKTKNIDSPAKMGAINSENINETIPDAYPYLVQNSPNPFVNETKIGYYLPISVKNANIYIYNMNGEQLKSYQLLQRGVGNHVIKGSELSAGIYIYALITDEKVIDTKRMILTK